jgi:hypothetical protein
VLPRSSRSRIHDDHLRVEGAFFAVPYFAVPYFAVPYFAVPYFAVPYFAVPFLATAFFGFGRSMLIGCR